MFSKAATGSKIGSAYGAWVRTTVCATKSRTPELKSVVQPANAPAPVEASTKIQAKTPINQAPISKTSSAERLVETQ